jgi:hypothetical protein
MRVVGSREYKLMLQASKFNGDEEKLLASAGALWGDLAAIIVPHVLSVSGGAEIEHKRRQVRFLDSAQKWLRSNDYVVRERLGLEDNEREVTLKFRHPDRHISQYGEMDPTEGFEKDLEFEEDIRPELLKLYSFSSSAIVPEDTKLATLADIPAVFPGLPKAIDESPEAEKLKVVGGFTTKLSRRAYHAEKP